MIKLLRSFLWFVAPRMSIYGGETIKESAKRLETAPIDIICATPGRLIALLDETKYLVWLVVSNMFYTGLLVVNNGGS